MTSIKNYLNIIRHLFHILASNPAFFAKRVMLGLKEFILPLPKRTVFKKINGLMFEFNFVYSDKIKQMYFGSFQPAISEVFRKYLKRGDVFIDAGANIGYFSAVAAGYVGKEGQVHSFEPVPEYFKKLKELAERNNQYRITANQFALGDQEKMGEIYIGGNSDIGDNTFFPNLFEGIDSGRSADVLIRRLDKYIKEKNITNIKLIKIDVEGYEFFVLKGLKNYFSECLEKKSFPIIVCEICPEIYPRLGYKLEDLFSYMEEFFYYPFDIFNNKIRMDIKEVKKRQAIDVLFINKYN